MVERRDCRVPSSALLRGRSTKEKYESLVGRMLIATHLTTLWYQTLWSPKDQGQTQRKAESLRSWRT